MMKTFLATYIGSEKGRKRKPKRASRCDKKKVAEFDYSALAPDFSTLAKPAQRALLNNGIRTPADLALRKLEDVLQFHGIGPSALPVLKAALKKVKKAKA